MIGASFAEAGYYGQYNERLAILLGLITVAFAVAVFVSCRTCVVLLERLGLKNPTANKGYQVFYRYHGYYWWGFWFVLLLHALVGLMHGFSVPESIDPDAYLHVPILWLGVAAVGAALVMVSSCRSPLAFLNQFRGNPGPGGRVYRLFFQYHTYYWLVLALAVAAHFALGYYHAGIWP